MSAVSKVAAKHTDLVLGLGATGLSIARYLRRNGVNAVFHDSRAQPPGIGELSDVWPGADVTLGDTALPNDIDRIVVSPGVVDDQDVPGAGGADLRNHGVVPQMRHGAYDDLDPVGLEELSKRLP